MISLHRSSDKQCQGNHTHTCTHTHTHTHTQRQPVPSSCLTWRTEHKVTSQEMTALDGDHEKNEQPIVIPLEHQINRYRHCTITCSFMLYNTVLHWFCRACWDTLLHCVVRCELHFVHESTPNSKAKEPFPEKDS